MARPPRPQNPPLSERRRLDPEEAAQAKALLTRKIAALITLPPLLERDYISKANILLDNAKATVRDVFGDDSHESNAFLLALRGIERNLSGGRSVDAEDRRVAEERVQEAIARLENLLKVVDEKTIEVGIAVAPTTTAPALSRRVFLVHGHNEEVKQTVARVLEKLDLQPIILHEQPDKNRTIIQKFEDYADVGFAVILMTGDDRGGPKDAPPESYRLRARQNVLFELGFFLGRLRRDQVCVLHEPEVEIPSNYSGVLFKPIDKGGAWKYALTDEIRAAGIDVDKNRLP